jgi:predicted DNA-binding protein with PD1-like motif
MIFRLLIAFFLFLCSCMPKLSRHPVNQGLHAFRILPGEDLKEQIELRVKQNGWKAAALVSAVGSLNKASIRFADQQNAAEVAGKLEIVSLSGTLSTAGCHLHIAVADSTGRTIGGHLMSGCEVYTTAEIVVAVLKDVEFIREKDETYGFRELKVLPLKKD